MSDPYAFGSLAPADMPSQQPALQDANVIALLRQAMARNPAMGASQAFMGAVAPHLADPATYGPRPAPTMEPNEAGKVPTADPRMLGGAADVGSLLGLGIGGPGATGAKIGAVAVGRAMRDPALWHGLSMVKLPRPISEMSSGRLVQQAPTAERLISPEALEGGILLPGLGDRSAVGGSLTHVGETPLQTPVPLQGGHGYMAENSPTGQVWASAKQVISTMANRAKMLSEREGAPVYLPYTAMGERAVDFSHHMSDTLADMVGSAGVSRAQAKAFNEKMLAPSTDFKADPNFPGVMSKNLREYLASSPGAIRNKFAKLMDTREMQQAGFPSVAEARFAVTDPRLLHEPTGAAGMSISRLDPNVVGPSAHRTYNTGIGGEYLGGFGQSVPKEVMYPNIIDAYRKQGYRPDQYDYLMGRGAAPVFQKADPQWLEGIMKYLRGQGR